MAPEDHPQSPAKHWQDCTDVYDLLEQIRLRPSMWLPGGSLRDLQAMLLGYQIAISVHSVDEAFSFWKFNQWLKERLGARSDSVSYGWAADIERNTPEGSTPVEEFFRLLDGFRLETARQLTPDATTNRHPNNE
ncbi:hypothetical protein ACIQXD_24475 [Streptomyces uncialis]|uniref:hypothetical protein n=1 Tax=Streptomyces uncialis TaxID=1048205 RepID=UPI00381DB611